jgi:hypothetical protein
MMMIFPKLGNLIQINIVYERMGGQGRGVEVGLPVFPSTLDVPEDVHIQYA